MVWHGCGKVNSDVFQSLQHRAAKLIFPNFGLGTEELNATLGLVPLINRRKLHIVLLNRKCLDYVNNYFNLNASVHAFTASLGLGGAIQLNMPFLVLLTKFREQLMIRNSLVVYSLTSVRLLIQ